MLLNASPTFLGALAEVLSALDSLAEHGLHSRVRHRHIGHCRGSETSLRMLIASSGQFAIG